MKVLVVGDDLTGCNAAGALFAQVGFTVLCITSEVRDAHNASESEIVILNTNSRITAADCAYRKMADALATLRTDPLISKRIDSTFRGNIGFELQAIKDSINNLYPARIIKFLVVPAFPDAGRTTKNGIHYLQGVPISESKVNTDQNQILTTSKVSQLLSAQIESPIGELSLFEINSSDEKLFEKLLEMQEEIIVCDGETNKHIRKIAKAAARVEKNSAINWIAVDPGPFSVALTSARNVEPSQSRPLIMSFVASHTAASVEQIQFSSSSLGAKWIKVDTGNLNNAKVLEQVIEFRDNGSIYIGIDFSQQNRQSFSTQPISDLSRLLVEAIRPAAVYASGGETAAAVLRGLEAKAFTIDFEILPLAVSGRIADGPFANMSFATKGGLIGSIEATSTCLQHLMQLSTYKRSLNQTNRKAATP